MKKRVYRMLKALRNDANNTKEEIKHDGTNYGNKKIVKGATTTIKTSKKGAK